jgi:hypothetical protein
MNRVGLGDDELDGASWIFCYEYDYLLHPDPFSHLLPLLPFF